MATLITSDNFISTENQCLINFYGLLSLCRMKNGRRYRKHVARANEKKQERRVEDEKNVKFDSEWG